MQRDIRETALYQEGEALYKALRQPGTGQISDAADIHVSPDGSQAVFAGTLVDRLEGTPPTRICRIDLISGEIRVVTFGPNTDRLPRFSPNGRQVAFLSDRRRAGDFQLYLLDLDSGAARPAPDVEGWVEYLHWSPDGRRILLGVAGHGADLSAGAISQQVPESQPSWMPKVESGNESYRWRSVWAYECASDSVRKVSRAESNVWEAAWCGSSALAVVISPGPGEGLWYSARLHIIEIDTKDSCEIYTPQDQLGWPTASPSGRHLAIVEAICSDRWYVAGDLLLIEISSRRVRRVDTQGVDITSTEWRSDRHLLLAGHRGLESVVILFDVDSGTVTEVWASRDVTTGGRFVSVSGFNAPGDCVLVGEGFMRAPEIAMIRKGRYQAVKSLDVGTARNLGSINAVEPVSWSAPDGLEIQGWLLRPKGNAPHPLVMNVHGGPVSHWRPFWLGRSIIGLSMLMLLNRGYVIFLPNPRGSSGRGQKFVRHVLGELGGADTHDCLSGVDNLVKEGIADAKRLGVTGISYGGFMTSWLITQDSRFAAAVSVSPVTNHVTHHLISNIPHFVSMFVEDRYTNPTGKYFERSPIMHAHRAKTPTLNITGALDRCTPPEEAVQFHNALLENNVKSVLAIYPEECHGVRKFPAVIDYTARVVDWFEQHISARNDSLVQRL